MKLFGIGIDLIDLAHFALHYSEADDDLLNRCFTEMEISDAGDGADRLPKLAVRFAAKEAAFKALGGIEGIALTDIEVRTGPTGLPRVYLHGEAARYSSDLGIIELQVSLTHSPAAAAAVVVAIGAE